MLSGLPFTLWRVSAFEQRYRMNSSMPAGLDGARVTTSSPMVELEELFRPLRPARGSLAVSSPTRAIGHAAGRMQIEAASLRHIAQWPGMSLERAFRLLNGLYLTSNLMVTRGHPRAHPAPNGPR